MRLSAQDSDGEEIVAAVRGAVTGEVRTDPAVAGKVLQEFNTIGSNHNTVLSV